MKKLLTALGLTLGLVGVASGEIAFGGADTTNVDNWTTNNVLFNQGTTDGYSLDWENVVVNTAMVDSAGNKFDLAFEAGTNYTIGHLFMYEGTVDLATLELGIEALNWTADFEASSFANWSPVISLTDGGVTTFYRWNHSGNTWNGNGVQDFSLGGQFDLSQLGNGSNPTTVIWGELVGTAGNFGATRINDSNPDLQAATGVVQFGFIQWGASTNGSVATGTTFTTAIDSFEVVVNPDEPTAPTVVATAATEITAVSATVGGEVTDTGNEVPNVTVYFGTTDGGTDPLAWDGLVDLGRQFGPFATELTELVLDTPYFFSVFAENSIGTDWSDPAEMFTTLTASAPTVESSPGTVTGPSSITVAGEVTETGNEAPNVTVYFGTTDGGTDPLMWDDFAELGPQDGAFSANLTGLDDDTTYMYRAFAENSVGSDWADSAESVMTPPFEGVTVTLDSSAFAYQYEMDEPPSGQDLDMAGSVTDWFAGVSGDVTIPQTYVGGVAFSNQAPGLAELSETTISLSGDDAILNWSVSEGSDVEVYGSNDLLDFFLIATVPSGTTTFTDAGVGAAFPDGYFYRLDPVSAGSIPEVLFRTDFGGSIQRQSLLGGDFTLEVALRVIGPKDAGGVGIFGMAVDPGGTRSAFRLNVDTSEVSQNGDGADLLTTTANDDAMHVFRIAYSEFDDRYWAWRDGVLIYAADLMNGVPGTNGGFNNNGSFFIGDFTSSLSGEWEVDSIRLHDDAVAPVVPE